MSVIRFDANQPLRLLMERMPISEVEGSLHELKTWGQSKPLSFLDLPFTGELATASLREAQRLKQSCDTLLVLGIGGSSLGTQAIASALGHAPQPRKRAVFADNIDPDHFFALVEGLDFAKTAVFIVSKSGSTVETWTQWLAIESQVTAVAKWQSRVVCCTDNESGALRSFARAHDLPLLPIPGNVGGRFSVLSPVGLFPAAFLSIDPQKLLSGAASLGRVDTWNSQSLVVQLAHAACASHQYGKNIHVLMPYSQKLATLSDWFVQIWAESLGKQNKGSTPGRAVGVTDQHSQMQLFLDGPEDKLVGCLAPKQFQNQFPLPKPAGSSTAASPPLFGLLGGHTMADVFHAERDATLATLEKSMRPTYTLTFDRVSAETVGALFFLYEAATACVGFWLHINPFDQPAVEHSKVLTQKILSQGR